MGSAEHPTIARNSSKGKGARERERERDESAGRAARAARACGCSSTMHDTHLAKVAGGAHPGARVGDARAGADDAAVARRQAVGAVEALVALERVALQRGRADHVRARAVVARRAAAALVALLDVVGGGLEARINVPEAPRRTHARRDGALGAVGAHARAALGRAAGRGRVRAAVAEVALVESKSEITSVGVSEIERERERGRGRGREGELTSVTTEVARSALETWAAWVAIASALPSPMAPAILPTSASVLSDLSSIVPRSFWNIVPFKSGRKSRKFFFMSKL